MKTRVVTLMWGTAWSRYGQTFYETFCRYWPDSVELVIVTDRLRKLDRATQIPFRDIPEIAAFRRKWSKDKSANGLNPPDGAKRNAQGYNFRWDAVKWMPQAMAPNAAAQGLQDGDLFCWLDADVETTAKVPEGWVESLLAGNDLTWLNRIKGAPEIGFYAMRMNRATRAILSDFSEAYSSGDVFSFRETHSGFVFAKCAHGKPVKVRNLCTGLRGHVWPKTELARYTVHKKGKRKP